MKRENKEIKFRLWIPHLNLLLAEWPIQAIDLHKMGQLSEDTVFCQFTGLKDKNDREIFEGDVLQWEEQGEFKNGIFEWNANAYGFRINKSVGIHLVPRLVEIIGNIYQNPELLTESTEYKSIIA